MGVTIERLRECRAVQKRIICELENALGVDRALPATMAALHTLEAIERIERDEAAHE